MRIVSVLFLSFCLLGFVGATPAQAESTAPRLVLPLDCIPNENCWIANYVDTDKAPKEAKDYRCGKRTYDTHKGTDFAVRDLRTMHMGMTVRAAAAGVVKGTRDGMEDISIRDLKDQISIKGKECGNGVFIAHADGWSTQYCHLKRSSILVRSGQKVEAGEALGQLGLSGKTEFPHLHMSLRKGKVVVDPFTGLGGNVDCGKTTSPLWDDYVLNNFTYGPAIYNAGFSGAVPKADAVRKGLYQGETLDKRVPALVLWADIFGVVAGDKVTVKITSPDGDVLLNHTSTNPKTLARRLAYAGKKKQRPFWPEGTYTGTFTIARPTDDGAEQTWSVSRTIEIR